MERVEKSVQEVIYTLFDTQWVQNQRVPIECDVGHEE